MADQVHRRGGLQSLHVERSAHVERGGAGGRAWGVHMQAVVYTAHTFFLFFLQHWVAQGQRGGEIQEC